MANEQHMNPFPGLRSFEGDEDYLFFGREEQTDALLKKLSHERFLAVIGTSGSGKSSLVKSGLLPFLYSGYMATAGSGWKVALSRPGDDPIGNLARSMAESGVLYDDEDGSMEGTYAAIIESTLRRSSLGLTDAVKQSEIPEHENLLIVIDQFEELFRFNRYERKSKEGKRDSLHFVSLLLKACQQRDVPIYVVITMRSDFLGECTQFRGLPEAINEGQYLIPRMTRDERKAAIVGPAAVSGTTISNRLLNRLLNDVGDNPDQLPILQHALMRLWSYWHEHHEEGEPIDLQHYEAIGTMERALSLHAEEAFAKLKTERERNLCEILFKSLTDKGANGQGIRRPCKLSEICAIANADIEEIKPIIEIFRKPGISFLMPPTSVELEEDTIIDISHESLMRVWTRLIEWVEDETQSAEIYLRLSEAAALYHEGKAGLWTGPELQLTLNWREYSNLNEFWAKRYDSSYERAFLFLDYSKDAYESNIAEKERRRKAVLKNTRRFTAILAVSLLVCILVAIWAMEQRETAEKATQKALDLNVEADSAKVDALMQKEAALQAKILADSAERDALQQKEAAFESKIFAEEQARLAERATIEAFLQKDTADQARELAESLKERSEELMKKAVTEKQRSDSLRLLQLSQALALKAVRADKVSDPDVSRILAYLAYKFNDENGGDCKDPNIYNALSYALDQEEGIEFLNHTEAVRAITIFNGGREIITGGDDSKINLWDASDPTRVVRSFNSLGTGATNLRGVQVSNDAKWLVYANSGGNVYATPLDGTGNPVLLHSGSNPVTCVEVDRKSGKIAASTTSGDVYVWDALNPASKRRIVSVASRINTLRFTPATGHIAIALKSGVVQVYSQSGDSLAEYFGVGSPILSMDFSPDGKWLVAGTEDGKILRMNMISGGGSYRSARAHSSGVNAVQFSSDSKSLATAGSDHLVKTWNVRDLSKETLVLNGHKKWVWDVVFGAAGNTLYSSGSDNKMRKWNINSEILHRSMCSRITRNLTKAEWEEYVGKDIKYQKVCNQ